MIKYKELIESLERTRSFNEQYSSEQEKHFWENPPVFLSVGEPCITLWGEITSTGSVFGAAVGLSITAHLNIPEDLRKEFTDLVMKINTRAKEAPSV